MRRFTNDEHGAVAVMVALCLVPMIGFMALAIDLGDARQRKAQAQNSADFAALAAAGVLLNNGTASAARAEARTYITRNDFSGADAVVNSPPVSGPRTGDANCIEVMPSESRGTTFARVFGIDSMSIGARAVGCLNPPLGGPYAVFAGSTTCAEAVSFSGSGRTVNGGVHSNNDMKIKSNGTVVNGYVTYLKGDAPAGNIEYNPSTHNPTRLSSTLEYPDHFEIADYRPLGSKGLLAEGLLRYHYAPLGIDPAWLTANLKLNALTKTMAPGIYYTPGDVHLNVAGLNSHAEGVTIVAEGNIHINSNNVTITPWDLDGLLLYSSKNQPSCSAGQAVIKLNGNSHSWEGIMYAPQGPIDFSGTNVTSSLKGRLVGQTVSLSGSSQTITRNESYPGRPGGIALVE